MKKLSILCTFILNIVIFGQVGIGTPTPDLSALLDLNSSNKGLLIPRISLTGTQDVLTIPNPSNGLLIYNLSTAGTGTDEVVANNFYKFNSALGKWDLLVTQENLSALSVPLPAIFTLTNGIVDFLSTASVGGQQVSPMTLRKNNIPGLTYDTATSTITFNNGGLYKIEYVYEGSHSASGCTISSYFVDFPYLNTTQRIHSTSSHNAGAGSNHGGIISYTTEIPDGKTWTIQLGRGQSGNCLGAGMFLKGITTQVFIYRIGS